MSTDQRDVKVEWDPEHYEESMAAIRAWGSNKYVINITQDQIQIANTNKSSEPIFYYRFKEQTCLYLQFNMLNGLTVMANGKSLIQVVRESENQIHHMPIIWLLDVETSKLNHLCAQNSELYIYKGDLEELHIGDWLNNIERLYIKKSPLKKVDITSANSKLGALAFYECKQLESVSFLKGSNSIKSLCFDHCSSMFNFKFLKCCDLNELNLIGYDLDWEDVLCDELPNLKALDLSESESLTSLSFLKNYKNIESLRLHSCESLISLDGLESVKQLKSLNLSDCKSLESIQSLSHLIELRHLNISDCKELKNINSIGHLSNLKSLDLSDCRSIEDLNPLIGLRHLVKLKLRYCYSLVDINGIANNESLEELDLGVCISLSEISIINRLKKLKKLEIDWHKELTHANFLSGLNDLIHLNLSWCESLEDTRTLNELSSLKWLDISSCKSIKSISFVENLKQMQFINMDSCEGVTNIEPIVNVNKLERLSLVSCNSITDFAPIQKLSKLTYLNLSKCKTIHKLDFLPKTDSLVTLDLSSCINLTDVSHVKNLTNVKDINLSGCINLPSLIGLSSAKNLIKINLSNNQSLTSLIGFPASFSLESVDLSRCGSLRSLEGTNESINITSIKLANCKMLSDISALEYHRNISSLDLSNCPSLTRIDNLEKLSKLETILLSNSPEIHSLEPLAQLSQLKVIRWLIPSKVSEVLLASALLRSDTKFIIGHIATWLQHFSLVKEPERFFRRLCDGIKLLADADRCAELAERGCAFTSTQLHLRAWRYWAQQTLTLPSERLANCFQVALEGLDSVDALEGRGAGVIGAMGQLADSKPAWTLDMVARTLSAILDQGELRRTIAPAAASFYAQWGEDKLVAEWIKHGTNPEAPIWRDRVLLALVEWASDTQRWEEAGRYLADIETDELRDKAHFELGARLIAEEPARVALHHLSQLVDEELRTQLALQLSEQGGLYTHPGALSRLIIALQAKPDLLGGLLAQMMKSQPESVATLKQLLFHEELYLARLLSEQAETVEALKEALLSPSGAEQAGGVELDLQALLEDEIWGDFTKKRALRAEVEVLEHLGSQALMTEVIQLGLARLFTQRGVVDQDEEAELVQSLLNRGRE